MIALALVALGVVALLVGASRVDARAPVSLVVMALAATAFGLAVAAVRTDYRDADGFIDCRPNCSGLHDTVGMALFAGPVGFLIALVGLVFGGRRSARRRAR